MHIQKKVFSNFSNLDLLDKLSILEKLLLNNVIKNSKSKSSKNFSELNNFKLLLDIIKFKHKVNSNNKEVNFLSLFNDIYLNTKKNINEVTTHE